MFVACWMLCLLVVGLFCNIHDSSPLMTLFTMFGSVPFHSRHSDFGFFICNCGSELITFLILKSLIIVLQIDFLFLFSIFAIAVVKQ